MYSTLCGPDTEMDLKPTVTLYTVVNPGLKRYVLFSWWMRDCIVDLMKLQKPSLHGAQEGQIMLPMEMLAVQFPMHQAKMIF